MEVVAGISSGRAKAWQAMTGIWMQSPWPTPRRTWYPEYLAAELPMLSVYVRPPPIVNIPLPMTRNGVKYPKRPTVAPLTAAKIAKIVLGIWNLTLYSQSLLTGPDNKW